MPAIHIPPDTAIAGGFRIGVKEITVGWNFLTGNPAKKRETIATTCQEWFDSWGEGYTNFDDLPLDDPDRDLPELSDHLGYFDNGAEFGTGETTRRFIWRESQNKRWLVERHHIVTFILETESDPTIGNNPRWVPVQRVNRG